MNKSSSGKDNVAIDNIDPKWDRWVSYQANGTLKVSDLSVLKGGEGWEDPTEVVLQNWEEICRLRDFLNKLEPLIIPEQMKEEIHLERATA